MEIRPRYDLKFPELKTQITPKAKPRRAKAKTPAKPLERKVARVPAVPKVKKPIQKIAKKKVKRVKAPNAQKKDLKAQKIEERENKLKGSLLQQLMMLDQRINTMEKDKERYCLLEMKELKDGKAFIMIKDEDPKKLTIKVGKNYEISCSCMDWKIRCRGMSIACKHIYYFLDKILTYELFEYYDNVIQKPELFEELMKRRIRLNCLDYKVKQDDRIEGEMCTICYLDFKQEEAPNLVKCPDCKNFLHRECMKVWLKNSPKRNCAVCKSESWATLFL